MNSTEAATGSAGRQSPHTPPQASSVRTGRMRLPVPSGPAPSPGDRSLSPQGPAPCASRSAGRPRAAPVRRQAASRALGSFGLFSDQGSVTQVCYRARTNGEHGVTQFLGHEVNRLDSGLQRPGGRLEGGLGAAHQIGAEGDALGGFDSVANSTGGDQREGGYAGGGLA